MRLDGPLLLVGCGKMGHALLTGWLEEGLETGDIFVVEPFDQARDCLALVTCRIEVGDQRQPIAFVDVRIG